IPSLFVIGSKDVGREGDPPLMRLEEGSPRSRGHNFMGLPQGFYCRANKEKAKQKIIVFSILFSF
ncbi:MAG: hypothetical protein LM558_00450, partial [Thermosphaera sp.]|nr:hypothetical protein [Thermosphaera sp.]